MAKTVVAVFDSFEQAGDAVRALDRIGIDSADVGIVATDPARDYDWGSPAAGGARMRVAADSEPGERVAAGGDAGATAAGEGAVAGGMIGGAAGLLAGVAALAIPGVGPLVAAGPLAAALAGAGVGAVAGGLIGGLTQVGVPDTDAGYYAEAVRRGGALLTVRADDDRAADVSRVLSEHGAVDLAGRVDAWRQAGWTGYDPHAQPYVREEIERERTTFRSQPGSTWARVRGDEGHPNLGSGAARPGIDPVSDRPRMADPQRGDPLEPGTRSGGGEGPDADPPGPRDRGER
jgi:hypothetical protein